MNKKGVKMQEKNENRQKRLVKIQTQRKIALTIAG